MTQGETPSRDGPRSFVSRPLGVRIVSAASILLLGLAVTGITAGVLPTSMSLAGGSLVLVASLLAAARSFRISIAADEHEVVVRNYLTTHRLRWEQISKVGIGVHHFFGQMPAVAIRTRGEPTSVTAQATVAGERECRRVIEALRKIRPDLPIQFSE